MMPVHDFKKYKESKTIVPHLEAILKVISLTERALSFYNSYLPVAKVLLVLKNEKSTLESYLVSYKKIRQSKGLK